MSKLDIWRAAALTVCLAAVPQAAPAQQYGVSDETQMVKTTDATYASLMSRLESLEASLAEATPRSDGWKDVSGEKWTQKINGRVHLDYGNFAQQNALSKTVVPDAQDYFDFRRMYLGIEGEGFGIYEYKFEVDLAPAFGVRNTTNTGTMNINGVQLKDVYWGIKEVPLLGTVLVGHFKAPISLEELTSSRYITFMERSSPNLFVPQRELGVAAYNRNAAETMTWGYGVYVDNLDEIAKEREDDNQGTSLVMRGTWLPYYDEPSNGRYLVHTGLAWRMTDDHDDTIQFRAREETGLGPRWIDTGTIRSDLFNVLQTEAAVVWGPFSVQTEFFYVPVHDNGKAATAAVPPVAALPYPGFPAIPAVPAWAGYAPTHRDFYGAYVYGSFFLTGENRKYRRDRGVFDRVTPNSNFWTIRGAGMGPGAVELTTRLSYLDLSMGGIPAGPGRPGNAGMETDLTVGVNWYLNPHLRWMFNYIHSWNVYDYRAGTAENDILAVSTRLDF